MQKEKCNLFWPEVIKMVYDVVISRSALFFETHPLTYVNLICFFLLF